MMAFDHVREVVDHAERRPTPQPDLADFTRRRGDQWVLVARAAQVEPSIQMQDAHQQRHRHGLTIVTRQLGVDTSHRSLEAGLGAYQQAARQCLGQGHKQRRRHALARDVADQKTKAPIVKRERVIEVATHTPSGLEDGVQLDRS